MWHVQAVAIPARGSLRRTAMGATALCCFSCLGVSESATNEMPAKAAPRTGCSCQMLSCTAQPQLPDLHGRQQGTARTKGLNPPGSHFPSLLCSIQSCWTSSQRNCVGLSPSSDPLETSQGCSPADPQPCEALWALPAGVSALLKGTKVEVETSQLLLQGRLRALPALQASGIVPSHLINSGA